MPSRPPVPARFFIDETSLDIARPLAAVRRDIVHPGHRDLPEVPIETDDTVWMPIVAARDLVVISRDAAIRRRAGELKVYRDNNLRCFWIAGRRDPPGSTWIYLVRLVRQWEVLERIVAERGPGPWAYAINESSVTELKVPAPRAPRDPSATAGRRERAAAGGTLWTDAQLGGRKRRR